MSEEGAVQVCVRMRPPNDREKSLQGGSAEALQIHWKADKQTVSQISGSKSFSFDRVFHPEESTATVYNEVAHSIVRSITEGYNGTIFAYGQTSSGKTYTMMGDAVSSGLIPLAICNLFNVINNTPNREFLLRVSYMEIYNESVSDLLVGPKRRPLEVREDMERTVYVASLTEELAVTYEDVMKLVQKGEKNRHYGETKMNEHSSRSHTIFRVIVESRDKNNEAVIVAHLNLVDLAGSERASQTGAEGVRLKEGCFINRSLFVLGQVIKKLSDGQAGGFLNYRDSKLTRILQNSLGGNAKTLIICTITPVSFEETLSTLQFASTAKFMKNTPHVNEVLDEQAMLKRCRKEIMDLTNQLEELTSETRVQAMEKAQLLSEKHILQMEHEQKIKNLTRMLVRVSTDDDQEMKARRKRRVTWAPGKLRASFDSSAKMIKLDKGCQELDEDEDDDDFDVDNAWTSKTISECNSSITTKRGGSCGFQIPPFEDSFYFNEQSKINPDCSSLLCDVSSKDELVKRISELEKQLETQTEEKEKEIKKEKEYARHVEKQLQDSIEICELLYSKQFDAESLKMENDKQKEEIEELKELLKERLEKAKFFQMENEKHKKEIKELEKLREGIEELKERREIEEFEFLEKEAEKEGKEQQHHENVIFKELVSNSETINQELEIKQLQQSLNDAEVVTRDAKKESSFLRSENLELKEEMGKMRADYQKMEIDVQLYSNQLDAERSRYKKMQCDLQKELNLAFNENTKLMSLLDGKVPKDLLDRFHLEKTMAELKQQLDKSEKEKNSLQEEVSLLSQFKSLPEKVDELAKQILQLTKELNDVTSERDTLSAGREDNVKQLETLRGEVSAITQDRNKLQEVLAKVKSEQDHQENIKTLQQNEMKCSLENLQTELDLYSTRLKEEKAKCVQFQHDIEDKERQVKEQELQLKQELEKQKEIDDKYSKSSEEIKLLKEEKQDLVIKLEVLMKTNEELMSQSKSDQKENPPSNVTIMPETTSQGFERDNLTEQLLLLQKNYASLSSEKEALHQELTALRAEKEQLKCDLQDNIEMCIENQTELRSLHDQLKLNQNVEMKLKKNLAETEHLLNEEKEKVQALTEELQMVASQHALESENQGLEVHDSNKQDTELQEKIFNQRLQQLEDEKTALMKEKDDLQAILEHVNIEKDAMKSAMQGKIEIIEKRSKELHCVISQRDILPTECEELRDQVSKESSAEIQEDKINWQLQQLKDENSSILKQKDDLQVMLESVTVQRDEMKSALKEKSERMLEQTEELHRVMSQRDMLLGEIEELRAPASKEQEAKIEYEINQRLQQLENEHSLIRKEKDNLQETLECVKEERNEMKSTLQEITEKIQEQTKELHQVVSQRDVLFGVIQELRASISKEQKVEIQEKEFNERLQQLRIEKATITKENKDLQAMLESVKSERDEIKTTLQENTEKMREQSEKLHHVVAQRDALLGEIDQLRAHVSKQQSTENLGEKFNQYLQQLEDEKLNVIKEKEDIQELLEHVKSRSNEMMSTLQGNTEAIQEQTKELRRVVSHQDELLSEIEQLRACVSKEQAVKIEEKELDQRLQQFDNEKSIIMKEKCNLEETLKSVKAQRDEMKRTLEENHYMLLKWTDELNGVRNHRDQLLVEIEQLKDEMTKVELLRQESNDQLERERKSITMQKDELQLQKDKIQKDLCDKAEMLTIEEKRNEELKKLVTTLEKQILTWKEETIQIASTNSETDPVEAEINKLNNCLREKDLQLQTTLHSLFELENDYKVGIAKTDQEFSRELEAWKELLLRICSEVPEGSTESMRIVKLQEENAKLYEKLVSWRSNFMRAMSTVPPRVKNYQKPISKCDVSLADEKKKNEELLSQLQALRKQVSDPSELQLVSEEKDTEIRQISALIANKEHHLKNAQQTLLELKSKYQKHLTTSENALLSKAKARKNLLETISKQPERNILKILEEIQNENQILDQECQLQLKTVQSVAALSESLRIGYIKYIRNSCDELENEKKKNDELLLQIEAIKQESLNKNGCDSLLTLENQKLSKKLKEAELLLQNERIKINELEATLTVSQEAYKQQEAKLSELHTELSSKAFEKNLDDLQTKLLKKDSQIKNLEETLEQLQAKLDMGAQPFKEEITDLRNRLFALQMEKLKETKHLENQISSLKASLEHKEELLRQLKETLRRNQQEQDTTIENTKDETCSSDMSLTCSAGSGIVQNAVVLVLNAEKAKLTRDLNQFKKENEHLTRMVSELKHEKNIWKERATKHEEKDRMPFKHENIHHTLCPDESLPPQCHKECSLPVSQNVETSKALFPAESKAPATQNKTLENVLPIDSSKTSSFGMESQLWPLPRTKIFDNSRLSFPGAASPQGKPKYEKNEHDDWWPKPSAADPECKMQ
ncbi:centromere-associated protein E isoform X2 [Stegostoma tigrinum]|uniref:centromere-associated protein E isoform X2 n=1 Tax=Stegostoma tigrinum TaxID=3053191 RepID=UPI00287041A4|nr:centromere-associated protein E isoform X2 [Stegostoma tigrinum]